MHELPRFFVFKGAIKRSRFLIEDSQVINHMRVVMRLKKGDKIELFDGEGREYIATIGFLTKTQAAGIVESEKDQSDYAKPAVFLAQALPKAGKLDDIVRMNTELGVQGFVLFDTAYAVVKKETYTKQKMFRLKRVAVEALRQSEAKVLPEFYGPMPFEEALDFKADYKLLLHSRDIPNAKNLLDVKKDIKPGKIVIVYIGPEGGFSATEIELAESKGAQICYLDLPILRTQTAGVVTNAIVLA